MYLKDLFIPLLKSSESLLPLAPLYFCLLFTLITAVLLRNGLRNDPLGGGTRDLLKASYSLLRMRGRTRKCVFYIMGRVITIGYAYTVHVPLS